MDKKAIVAAISDPDLVRRVFKVLMGDPGPLALVYEGTDSTFGYDAAYRIYFSDKKDFIIAAEQGECNPGRATMISIGLLAQWLNQVGHMTDDSSVSCLAVVTDSTLDHYCAKGYPLIAEYTRPDGTCAHRKFPGSDGWLALVLGRDDDSVEEVISDMEAKLHGN